MMEGTEAMRRERKGVLVWLPVRESWRSRERQTEVLCVLLSESADKVTVKSSQHLPSILIFKGLSGSSVIKSPPTNAEDAGNMGSNAELGRALGEGKGNPFQGSRLENPKGRGAWWAIVHGVATSQTGVSTLTLIFKLLHVLIILV